MSDPNSDPNAASHLFGGLSGVDRVAALDLLGKLLMEARDNAIIQWDQILSGKRNYEPWNRALSRIPIDEDARRAISEVFPHVIDTFIYCLLAELDATDSVRLSVAVASEFKDVKGISWGLPAEPTGDQGWLERFAKQRFEQPD